jgi:hypothetical protein
VIALLPHVRNSEVRITYPSEMLKNTLTAISLSPVIKGLKLWYL